MFPFLYAFIWFENINFHTFLEKLSFQILQYIFYCSVVKKVKTDTELILIRSIVLFKYDFIKLQLGYKAQIV